MSDRMTPISFSDLMTWILEEHKKGTVFGMHRPYAANQESNYEIFGKKLETPMGPAAGPNTQLAQNIIASYYGGARFFELKTVQKLDGEDLPVAKPCIKADDECYNVEWSTELYVPQAFDEYVKAWFALKAISKEFGLGAADGFQFNMSVGYDLEGIKLPKIDKFIEGLKDASDTDIYKECKTWLEENLDKFENLTLKDVEAIGPQITNSATLSTLHGCPPQEIERIARYLLEEKHVHTFVKCNPTLLGYEYARKTMDEMGYDYVAFGEFHFKDDLQYADAIPMLHRLQEVASEKNLEFGVKITNTFPVDIKAGELPGEEMYMSGKSLYALSLSVARNLARDFDGKIRISYSGGADAMNIKGIIDAGIWPVTMATTLLKPGGYERFEQIAKILEDEEVKPFTGVDVAKAEALVEDAKTNRYHVKAIKPLPSRKMKKQVPLVDCFTAPCEEQCPIHQDITSYMKLVSQGKMAEALEVIIDKNPLPFITGTICAHTCMDKCTRNFYETPVNIRRCKLEAAKGGYDEVIAKLDKPEITTDKTAVIVGGGPAGLAAGYFLARGGMQATIIEKKSKMGGVPRNSISGFRMTDEDIDKDVALVKAMGVNFINDTTVENLDELRKEYDYVILAVGAADRGNLVLDGKETYNGIEFLEDFNVTNGHVNLGKNVAVIGGGNTAMDVARASKRNEGVEKVSLVYRRTKRYMPADEEELLMVIEDGIDFAELLAPVKMEDGQLICRKMKLGDYDASGRRSVIETEETVLVPADTVIAAVGEKVPTKFYEANGIQVNERGRALVNQETMETSVDGVYVAGDCVYGPATIVEGIRDGKMAAEAILGKKYDKSFATMSPAKEVYGRKGNLKEEDAKVADSNRCLSCNSYCENCVEVCPNRANISIVVPGMVKHQIIHVDYMCNECGNCKSFCPYDSAPYQDKFTLFANQKDMDDSKNHGFLVADKESGECKVRIAGRTFDYKVGTEPEAVPAGLRGIIDTVVKSYSYML